MLSSVRTCLRYQRDWILNGQHDGAVGLLNVKSTALEKFIVIRRVDVLEKTYDRSDCKGDAENRAWRTSLVYMDSEQVRPDFRHAVTPATLCACGPTRAIAHKIIKFDRRTGDPVAY